MPLVYSIGNPLIDYLCYVTEEDLKKLGLNKGTMLLIDADKRAEIIEYTRNRKISYSCGGSAPNTMITLRMLGTNTIIAGGLGNDEHGRMYKEKLEKIGVIDQTALKDAVTGTSIILLTDDKERTMNTFLGANRLYSEEDVLEDSIDKADLFYFTGYMWDTISQQKATKKVLDLCREKGKKIAFDLADPFAVGRYRETFLNLVSEYCDIVFANSEEARFLLDNYDAYECCRSLGKLCSLAIIKNGKKGSFISDNGKIYEIPLYGTSKPVDTTGAGDTYAAGFLYGFLNGYDTETSGRIASYLAGEIISQIGAQFTSDKIIELKEYVDNNILK